MTELFQSIF